MDQETVERRLTALREEASRFETRTGLSGADPGRTAGAVQYLNMGEDDLNTMTAEELGTAAVAVGNMAFHLQNEFAKNASEAKRYFGAARRLVSKTVAAQQGYQSEERVLSAIQSDPGAVRLDTLAQEYQQKADRLAYLAKQAEFAASLMMTLSRARRPRSGGGND